MQLSAENLKKHIAEFFEKSSSDLHDDLLLKDLVQDSFLLVELVMGIQEDFGIQIMQEDLKDADTIGKLINSFMAKN
jgi:acyl carrier protein